MSGKPVDPESSDESDLDFNPDEKQQENKSSGEESDTEVAPADYEKIQTGEGGFIRTRTQKLADKVKEKNFNLASRNDSSSVNIDSIWAEMQNGPEPKQDLEVSGEVKEEGDRRNNEKEKVKIDISYEFAGETVHQSKWVDADSAEAIAFKNSVSLKSQPEQEVRKDGKRKLMENGKLKKPPRKKRPSLLDAVINDSKASKLSTLEKSRLDWASYVDNQGIRDDLKSNEKGGYLEKQDFLARVEAKKDEQYQDVKAMQRKGNS